MVGKSRGGRSAKIPGTTFLLTPTSTKPKHITPLWLPSTARDTISMVQMLRKRV
jgi:hypothetical protein